MWVKWKIISYKNAELGRPGTVEGRSSMKKITHPWVIWYAILLHYWWAFMLSVSAAPLGVTALHSARMFLFNGTITAVIMFLVATMALISLVLSFRGWWNLGMLLPQQILLVFSAVGAVGAIASGHFPTGTDSFPWEFISADQAPAILVALLHTAAIIDLHSRRGSLQKQLVTTILDGDLSKDSDLAAIKRLRQAVLDAVRLSEK